MSHLRCHVLILLFAFGFSNPIEKKDKHRTRVKLQAGSQNVRELWREKTFLVGRNGKEQDYLLRKVKGTREHTARVTPEIMYSGQKASLKLLFNLTGDVGISGVQTQKETIIDMMCNQSVGISFAGYNL